MVLTKTMTIFLLPMFHCNMLFKTTLLKQKGSVHLLELRENLYCIVSEAFQHVCNITIFTVSITTVLLLRVFFCSEQTIPLVLLLHMFLMRVAVVRITITERALYELLHSKIKSSVVSKPHIGIKLFSAKSTSKKCRRLRNFFMSDPYVSN